MWGKSNLQMDNVTKQQKQLQMWEESNLQMDNVTKQQQTATDVGRK